MDDTLSVVKDIPTATAFLATLSEAHPAISFTMEVANFNKVPFIGIELIMIGKQLKTWSTGKQQIKAYFSTIKAMLMPVTNDPF